MIETNNTIHIRYDGQSQDLTFDQLGDVGQLSSDREILQAIATYFRSPVEKFSSFHVDRSETGDITVRPNPVWG